MATGHARVMERRGFLSSVLVGVLSRLVPPPRGVDRYQGLSLDEMRRGRGVRSGPIGNADAPYASMHVSVTPGAPGTPVLSAWTALNPKLPFTSLCIVNGQLVIEHHACGTLSAAEGNHVQRYRGVT